MQCHECGETISDKAADCPHCGASVRSLSGDPGSEASDEGRVPPDADDPGDSPATEPTQPVDPDSDDDFFDSMDGPAGPDDDSGGSPATKPTQRVDPDSDDDIFDSTEGADDPGTAAGGASAGAASGGMANERDQAAGGQGPPPGGGQGASQGTGRGPPPQNTGQGTSSREQAASRETQQGPPGEPEAESGFDAGEFVGRIPFFPGAAAGFAVGIILFTVSVAYAAMIPGSSLSTPELGALVMLDLQFATTGHVTPNLFDLFDIVSPTAAAIGFLYLLAPLGLYTASKLVVSINSDEETTIPESLVGGLTPLIGYVPVVILAFVLASRDGSVAPSILGLAIAALLYPVTFGILGGLYGYLDGGERRVGTVYAFGAVFAIALGCFVATFVATLSAPGSPALLTHVFLGTFSYVAANVFAFGGGPVLGAAGVLAVLVVGLTVFAAAFVRAWRASGNESALRGVAKGATLAPTYLVVLGFYASVVPWLADPYIRDEIGMEFLAAGYADFIVRMRLSGIFSYVVAVLFGTVVFALVNGAIAGGLATLLREEIRGE